MVALINIEIYYRLNIKELFFIVDAQRFSQFNKIFVSYNQLNRKTQVTVWISEMLSIVAKNSTKWLVRKFPEHISKGVSIWYEYWTLIESHITCYIPMIFPNKLRFK